MTIVQIPVVHRIEREWTLEERDAEKARRCSTLAKEGRHVLGRVEGPIFLCGKGGGDIFYVRRCTGRARLTGHFEGACSVLRIQSSLNAQPDDEELGHA